MACARSLRVETPCASCLTFLMREKNVVNVKPELIPAVNDKNDPQKMHRLRAVSNIFYWRA